MVFLKHQVCLITAYGVDFLQPSSKAEWEWDVEGHEDVQAEKVGPFSLEERRLHGNLIAAF